MKVFSSLFVLGCLVSLAVAKRGQKRPQRNHEKVFHMAKDDSECGSVTREEWSTDSPAESCQAVGDEICFCVSKTDGESWTHKCGTCKFGLEMDNPAERRQRKKGKSLKAATKQEKKQLKKQIKKQLKKQQKKQERKQERKQRRMERRNQKKNTVSDESMVDDVSDVSDTINQVSVDQVAVN